MIGVKPIWWDEFVIVLMDGTLSLKDAAPPKVKKEFEEMVKGVD